jgi:hypothetical protein
MLEGLHGDDVAARVDARDEQAHEPLARSGLTEEIGILRQLESNTDDAAVTRIRDGSVDMEFPAPSIFT